MPNLDEKELRAIIYCRLTAASDSCNSHHRNRVYGQIQGLLYALTGEYLSLGDHSPTSDIFDFAGIPYKKLKGGATLEIPDEWMKEHGFDPDGKGGYGDHHPRFSERW